MDVFRLVLSVYRYTVSILKVLVGKGKNKKSFHFFSLKPVMIEKRNFANSYITLQVHYI